MANESQQLDGPMSYGILRQLTKLRQQENLAVKPIASPNVTVREWPLEELAAFWSKLRSWWNRLWRAVVAPGRI